MDRNCPPIRPQNECILWFGSFAIQPMQKVHLRHGNALKLAIRRGIPVPLQDLLMMTDSELRSALQNSIWGEIFQRPNYPVFPSEALHFQAAVDNLGASASSTASYAAGRQQVPDNRPGSARCV
jgi:hypothetical protein